MRMSKNGGNCFLIDFKYEKLPNFCFLCGLIGHTDRLCYKHFKGVNEETERPYGDWLRATRRRSTAAMGSPWLVTETPRMTTREQTRTQDVEMVDSGMRQSTKNVGHSERTTVTTTEADDRHSEFQAVIKDKNWNEHNRALDGSPSTDDYYSHGPKEVDPKRKRGSMSECLGR